LKIEDFEGVPTYVWVNRIFDTEIIRVSSGGKGMRKLIFLASECCFPGCVDNCGWGPSRVGILSYPFVKFNAIFLHKIFIYLCADVFSNLLLIFLLDRNIK